MSPSRPRSTSRGLARLAFYYVALGLVVATLLWLAPGARGILAGGGLQALGAADVFGNVPAVGTEVALGPWGGAVLGTISMLGALAVMVPVTWVYMLTRSRRGYHESVVHTLLILPVAVTGIIMVVQYNLALAFSLAGVVAAVRFRTTLEDTKDAVYVFLAIGVGLAAGVQALGLALALSLVFNGVILVLWRTNFGNVYADQYGSGEGLELGDVLAGPDSALTARHVGDPAVLEGVAPKDLAQVAERAVRWERYISEERGKKKSRRANVLLLVAAGEAAPAQAHVDAVLSELATRSRLAEIVPNPPHGVVLEYYARLEDGGTEGALLDRIRSAPAGAVQAAEVRSLRGLSPRA